MVYVISTRVSRRRLFVQRRCRGRRTLSTLLIASCLIRWVGSSGLLLLWVLLYVVSARLLRMS